MWFIFIAACLFSACPAYSLASRPITADSAFGREQSIRPAGFPPALAPVSLAHREQDQLRPERGAVCAGGFGGGEHRL